MVREKPWADLIWIMNYAKSEGLGMTDIHCSLGRKSDEDVTGYDFAFIVLPGLIP